MKTPLKAFSIGVSVEIALIAAFALGGFGPCGPASPLSAFVFYIHAPVLSALGTLEPFGLLFGLALYAAIWSGLAYFILECCPPRKL